MAPIRLMALLYAAHALQPLTILPVGRPLLPLDTISYGIETKTFEELTAQHDDDRSPIVVGLHAPNTDAGTLCILDASRATEEFNRIRVPAEGRPLRRVASNQSCRCCSRARATRSARPSDGRLAMAEFK